jgi:hypothetical protein
MHCIPAPDVLRRDVPRIGVIPLPAPPLNALFDKRHWTKPLRGNTLI